MEARDPNKPKRARTAFLLFSQHVRPIVVEEFPDYTFVAVAKEIAQRWKRADPTTKEVSASFARGSWSTRVLRG